MDQSSGRWHREETMSPDSHPLSPSAIEHRIRELVDQEGVLTFSALTTRLPDCGWITLFRALSQLEKQHTIRLIPIPRDYQISAARLATPPQKTGQPKLEDVPTMRRTGPTGMAG
jgi:hypothetical protein